MTRRLALCSALCTLLFGVMANAQRPPMLVTSEPFTEDKEKEKAQRGRIQAQGGKLEDSEAWAQDEAPTKKDLLDKLDTLWGRLTKKQKEERQKGYDEAKKWIEGLPEAGADSPVSKSFPKQNDGENRIDIEIIKGKAGTGKKP
jgi:hypothetical protein